MIVQIYAFTDPEQAVAAAEMGVDQIGFVAGHYGEKVPGELSFDAARRLVEALPRTAKAVALTMSTQVDEILRMAEAVGPDFAHVSTDPFDVGLEAMAELRKR
ncbi:MAG: phosphoribosylanthranilate isomerase, partial [Chloroflexi bacterium]|nr:phosphoribosylanthranilate isomerase [Chloroflexota bacterium]